MRWFGSPWPSEEKRAAVCENDNLRADATNQICIECQSIIKESDHGVITACSGRIWGGWDLDGVRVCAYHLTCWLRLVVNGELPREVITRMPGRQDEISAMLNKEGEETIPDENIGGWRTGK